MLFRLTSLIVAASLVSACSLSIAPKQYASKPGKPYSCLKYAISVDIEAPPNGFLGDPFVDRIMTAARAKSLSPANEPVSNSMLFLSGGSQHGAFGAGFLNRWSETRGGLPRFRVVTGISTGALQSTLAFTGESRETVNRYAITSERELLDSNTTARLGGGTLEAARAAITIFRKGALAELNPLRAQLVGSGAQDASAIVTSARLAKVADEANDGRKLFVGAVEMDTAGAVAFDLSLIAQDYVAEVDPARKEDLRQCYAEALVASSSVPIAAQPRFIEGKMFIDGGARFGVLPAKLLEIGRRMVDEGMVPAKNRPNLFILVNGTLQTQQTCDLKKCESDAPEVSFPIKTGNSKAHLNWSFPDLAFRSLSILISQSYASSVELARRDAEWCQREPVVAAAEDKCASNTQSDAMTVHFVRILPANLADETLQFPINGLREPISADNPYEDEKRNCDAWSKLDETLEKPRPHEFHPRYMRCLIRYGTKVADDLNWSRFEPKVGVLRR